MNELITPELSDRYLRFLVEKINLGDYEEFKSHDFPLSDKISVDAVDVILDDLKEKELIEILSRGHSGYDYTYEISVNKTAVDFLHRGGFTHQENQLRPTLEKLIAELDAINGLPEKNMSRINDLANELKAFLAELPKS
ncbi:hypothetical protein GCM10023091_10300 [Ravibacter arvi]|uniref:Uncharacterized protein n=1 Tax=Ravibacter arvi TaxID=2051041 RepID=A0ABP8LUB1_9BACT